MNAPEFVYLPDDKSRPPDVDLSTPALCSNRSPEDEDGHAYRCDLYGGHQGNHAALNAWRNFAIAVWTGEA